MKADGCFLWAKYMLEEIADASSLRAIHDQISVGLPSDYEKYYKSKMKSIKLMYAAKKSETFQGMNA